MRAWFTVGFASFAARDTSEWRFPDHRSNLHRVVARLAGISESTLCRSHFSARANLRLCNEIGSSPPSSLRRSPREYQTRRIYRVWCWHLLCRSLPGSSASPQPVCLQKSGDTPPWPASGSRACDVVTSPAPEFSRHFGVVESRTPRFRKGFRGATRCTWAVRVARKSLRRSVLAHRAETGPWSAKSLQESPPPARAIALRADESGTVHGGVRARRAAPLAVPHRSGRQVHDLEPSLTVREGTSDGR